MRATGGQLTRPDSCLHHAVDNLRVSAVNNVQPGPETIYLTELVRAMRNEHWRLSRQTLGIATVEQWITEPAQLTALDSGFAQLLRVWMEYQGLPELHGAYVAPNWHLHVWAKRAMKSYACTTWNPDQTACRTGGLATAATAQRSLNPSATTSGLPALRWWDRSGMAPMVSALGQISPNGHAASDATRPLSAMIDGEHRLTALLLRVVGHVEYPK
jgi:hypothetical protein